MLQTSIQVLIDQIEKVAHETDFSGVISIHQAESPLYEQAFGFRDIQNRLLNFPGTRFGIASGTKFFTALGIGRLINQGLLQLETQVGELSPDYVDFINPRATIRHLLTHTSGIYDYCDEEIEQDFDHFFCFDTLVSPGNPHRLLAVIPWTGPEISTG